MDFINEIIGVPRLLLNRPNSNVVFFGTLKKSISKEELQKIIFNLSHKHKLLNCKINSNNDTFYYLIDKNIEPDIVQYSNTNIEDLLKKELKHFFDIEKGPLIKFGLLKKNKEMTLIINSHHTICDGMSLVYLFKDIEKMLLGIDIDYSSRKFLFLEPSNIPQNLGNWLEKFIFYFINKKWSKKKFSITNMERLSIHEGFWRKHEPQLFIHCFSEEETAKIITRCKENRITVNTGITTGLLYIQHKLLEKKNYSDNFIIADNLRQYLIDDPKDKLGYFASALRLKLRYNNNLNFWENAMQFQSRIQKEFDTNKFESQKINLLSPKLLDAILLNLFGYRDDKIAKKMIRKSNMDIVNSTFTIANLGLVHSEENSLINTLQGPVVYSDTMEKYVGVLTYNKKLRMIISSNPKLVSNSEVQAIIGQLIGLFK
ncbi:hypothetical protein GF327_08115 [Candidatus Woesearchaeota archaeon]|nr:hypothetical protein [Candidatus Woesearchaeota archaeon]